jgi:hypothetical protein
MQTVILAIGLYVMGILLAVTSFAAKVGDQAFYQGTMANAISSIPVTLQQKVVSQNPNGTFNVETAISVQGQTQTSTASRTAEEVGDEAQAAQIVDQCAAKGGVPEAMTIGSGETLKTCKITTVRNRDLTVVHIAAVPFLNARFQQTANGIITTLMLDSYTRGQE